MACPDSPRCCICKSLNHLAIECEYSWCSSVINSDIPSSCQNSSVTKLNATVAKMDVEDSSSAFAPAASNTVVLVHVPYPVQPQQSQT